MVESNSVEHPANGHSEEGARASSIGFTGAWGITAAFAVLLGILGVASWTTNETNKASQWVAHTYEVEGHLQKMLSVLQDAETGQRGYLLTGNDAYLEPFILATGRIDDIVAELCVLTGDNRNRGKRPGGQAAARWRMRSGKGRMGGAPGMSSRLPR